MARYCARKNRCRSRRTPGCASRFLDLEDQPRSVLDVAQSLNLEGPPDWSERFDEYLYGTDAEE